MDEEQEHDPLMKLEDDFDNDPPKVHHPYSAWNQGYNAAEEEIPRSLNPYDEGTRESDWWDNGYQEFLDQGMES